MKAAYLALVLTITALLSSCGSTRIGRILAEPARYQNRNVTVEGRVTTAFGASLPGINVPGLYQVEDESGKIYVVSTRGVPTKDARVRVKGTVTPGLSLGGRSFGTAIRATDFRVQY